MEMIHELKTMPIFFEAVWSGRKTFEVRENDRDFAVGDTLRLWEYDKNRRKPYTGRFIDCDVTYTTMFMQYDGFIVMSIANLRRSS